eukprot:CAMPEP_0173171108 /NCGR_PEP_ID=MMETSP1141-20130122/1587_1 /TAXON_ID=483371 /ORGANISM="non described non described, Strain CCMP2298" /LENGTH=500 /DNA_ID=CAMNT_0014093031 /DNA_START=62 /DNA_END=1560 /DNA_ORIENTATION=-
MGQSVSTPNPHQDVVDFLNFPKEALASLWESYNLLGEGWGLNLEEMTAIFNEAEFVALNYSFSRVQLKKLFEAFDTDANGLIDALELFVAIALASGMDTIDKLHFCFCCYDFDLCGSLSFDETALLLRSVSKGLSKVSPSSMIFSAPSSPEVEKFTSLVFDHAKVSLLGRISTAEFRQYCAQHPVTSSWLKSAAGFPAPDAANLDLSPMAFVPTSGRVKSSADPRKTGAFLSEAEFEEAQAARVVEVVAVVEVEEELGEEEAEARKLAALAAVVVDPNAPPRPFWATAALLMKPEDSSDVVRSDRAEDVFEPVWVTGVNTGRVGSAEPNSEAFSETVFSSLHRCVRYADMSPPPIVEGEGEEGAIPVPSAQVLGTVGSQVLRMRKGEEGWVQRVSCEHKAQICAMDLHYGANLLVTAENTGRDFESAGGIIVLWTLDTTVAKQTITAPLGVRFLDISACGKFLLTLGADLGATATMYEICNTSVVFCKQLLMGARSVRDA